MNALASHRVDRAVLLALAERCEREEPSRALDEVIAAAAGWQNIHSPYGTPVGEVPGAPDDWDTIPFFSASLDAAVTLVPQGCAWSAGRGLDFVPNAIVWGQDIHADTSATTAALALCAAALKAKAA